MELVRCLDTLTPSYFKSSNDGWLEKRSERIAHRHPARLFFQKREKWLAVVNKVGEWLGKRRVVQKPAQSERGDKSWDSPSLPERKKKTMMPHTPSFWRQISFLFSFLDFCFVSFLFHFISSSLLLHFHFLLLLLLFHRILARQFLQYIISLWKTKGKWTVYSLKKTLKKKKGFREFRPGFSFFPCVFLGLNKYGTEAIDRLARLESS